MPRKWVEARRRDHYYRTAKREGYRSRAAYKLLQINRKYKILSAGGTVIDLGAAPGGWSQVALKLVGANGRVIALDLAPILPLNNLEVVRGDITENATVEQLRALVTSADVILSDISPRLSGITTIDQAEMLYLGEHVLRCVDELLRPGGNFVTKAFQGERFLEYLQNVRKRFRQCKVHTPQASLARSREIYIIGKGFIGHHGPK